VINPIIDPDLLRHYDKTGPRYTSYPTALQFTEKFRDADYHRAARTSNRHPDRALSLYYHIPFCATLCFYCACSKIITKNRARGEEYLGYLFREIELQGDLYERHRKVTQLHLGGGTPTFLSIPQITGLLDHTARHFTLSSDEERDFSIEIDPRTVSVETVQELRNIGFTRLSLGVQDFDPAVQKAVHRIQSQQDTLEIIEVAKKAEFNSINVDLIYGLPLQTVSSFARTLDTIIAVAPDRLSIFNYAHLPDLFSPQRRIKEEELPGADEKIDMLQNIVQRLTEAGYIYIGMDHFARPDDSLVRARDEHTLYRNFQGYASHADCDLVGMGITSISKVANCYSQNVKTMDEYYTLISNHQLPIARGITLNNDDQMRRRIIELLMCYGSVEFELIEKEYEINFRDYFSEELAAMEKMQQDGLLDVSSGKISVRPSGRFLIRNISMIFDAYIHQHKDTPKFSRLI
jgi:oxygen-independent coproporphyrinogen-3 oxidase